MTQFIDTMLFLAFAVFLFVMALLFAGKDPAPYASLVCMFLSIGSFGLAGYRATH